MAEEIKFVEEAPESQPSVREKLAWVPGYPRDRLDEFLDNIALLVSQAREQANLAETRASQATLEAYNAAGSRQAAAASALEGLGYKQAADKSAGDSATEADRSSEEADRAKEEADRVLRDLAIHTENPEAHPQYVKAGLPLGTTLEQQFAWTLEGWRSVVSGGAEVRCFAPASDAVAGSLQLNETLGWNDPVLAENGDYIMLYTDMVGGPERQSPVVKSGGWWFVSTREISPDYFVQMMYSDYGDTCTRYFTVSPGESGPVVEAGDPWQILAKADFYYTERFQNANRATTGTPSVRKIVQGDLASNALYHTNTDIKAFELPSGKVDGFAWYGGGVWFTVSNMTAEPVNIIGVETTVINGVIGLAPDIAYESNHQVVVPPWCTARIRSLYPNNWLVSVERADGGTAEPVNKPPVFLDNASVPISNYAKHRIMRSGPEAEGTALAFSLPTDAEGWVEFSVDHAWETDELGKLKTPLVLVAAGTDLISTNGGDYQAVKLLYRNDLTAFRRGSKWHINDCVEYVATPSVTEVSYVYVDWNGDNVSWDLMQDVKQIPTVPNGDTWWISWNSRHYSINHLKSTGEVEVSSRTSLYLTSHDLILSTILCLTVRWDKATNKPVFYAVAATASGLSKHLAEGTWDNDTGVITWNSIVTFSFDFQSIAATDSGFVVAIGDTITDILELKYHAAGIPAGITTYPNTAASNSNHIWGLSTMVRGRGESGVGTATQTATLLDGTEVSWFHKGKDRLVFSTTDGVAVRTYQEPVTGYDLAVTATQLSAATAVAEYHTMCFDHYQNMLCYGHNSDTSKLWYRNAETTSNFEADFYASPGKFGIRLLTLDWGLHPADMPYYAALVADEYLVGLSPSMEDHYFRTTGLKPGLDPDSPNIPGSAARDDLGVAGFGYSMQAAPGGSDVWSGRSSYGLFYYRYMSTGTGNYTIHFGKDNNVTDGLRKAGIYDWDA